MSVRPPGSDRRSDARFRRIASSFVGYWLHFGASLPFNSQGINLPGAITTPPFPDSAGFVGWNQLVDSVLTISPDAGPVASVNTEGYVLDKSTLQNDNNVMGGAASTQILLQNLWGDSPGVQASGNLQVNIEDYFKDSIMYQPNTPNSIPVMLGVASWHFVASAAYIGPAGAGHWTLTDVGVTQSIIPFKESSVLPEWNQNAVNITSHVVVVAST